jgi:hypothetical protein
MSVYDLLYEAPEKRRRILAIRVDRAGIDVI